MNRNKIVSMMLATTLVLQPIMSTLASQSTIAIAEEQNRGEKLAIKDYDYKYPNTVKYLTNAYANKSVFIISSTTPSVGKGRVKFNDGRVLDIDLSNPNSGLYNKASMYASNGCFNEDYVVLDYCFEKDGSTHSDSYYYKYIVVNKKTLDYKIFDSGTVSDNKSKEYLIDNNLKITNGSRESSWKVVEKDFDITTGNQMASAKKFGTKEELYITENGQLTDKVQYSRFLYGAYSDLYKALVKDKKLTIDGEIARGILHCNLNNNKYEDFYRNIMVYCHSEYSQKEWVDALVDSGIVINYSTYLWVILKDYEPGLKYGLNLNKLLLKSDMSVFQGMLKNKSLVKSSECDKALAVCEDLLEFRNCLDNMLKSTYYSKSAVDEIVNIITKVKENLSDFNFSTEITKPSQIEFSADTLEENVMKEVVGAFKKDLTNIDNYSQAKLDSLVSLREDTKVEATKAECNNILKDVSDKLTDKAEISRLQGDITKARLCVTKLPSSEASLKTGYLQRLNQIQMINMDSSIIDAVQALAKSINETLASKNYTKDSLVKLKKEADDTQNNFENIIDPMIKSRAVSFMAMPYSNLCKTIDDMDMISSDDAINEAIKIADKDMTQLINIYVTIENMSKDDPNKSKYEELIKNKIEEVLKGSNDLKGDISKIKDALTGNTISKEELENLIKDIKDEALKSQLEKDLGIESKPEIPTIDLEEITNAVVKAEKSKEQRDIDDALTKVNQMPNGVDKDKLLDRINNISKTETPTNPDLNSPLTVSKDLTVKSSSSNSLELLLDTNEVAFEDYNGAKDSEKINAVTATVSSSLPFDLSVTQLNEIESSNGNKMADSLLNFRETGKEYSSLGKGNKVTILQNHESGKNINTVFDIKLKGDSSVKKDNYSTTLRFEAMQK